MKSMLKLIISLIILTSPIISCDKLPERSKKSGKEGKEIKEILDGVPLYPGSVQDSEKCGEGAYYIEGVKPTVVSKEYCEMLTERGWKLGHGKICSSFEAGGYTFEKEGKKLLVTLIKYNEENTCYYPRYPRY